MHIDCLNTVSVSKENNKIGIISIKYNLLYPKLNEMYTLRYTFMKHKLHVIVSFRWAKSSVVVCLLIA